MEGQREGKKEIKWGQFHIFIWTQSHHNDINLFPKLMAQPPLKYLVFKKKKIVCAHVCTRHVDNCLRDLSSPSTSLKQNLLFLLLHRILQACLPLCLGGCFRFHLAVRVLGLQMQTSAASGFYVSSRDKPGLSGFHVQCSYY